MDTAKNLVDINDYIKLNQIGKGSYSNVFKIKNKKTKKIYAAKILGPLEENEKYIKNEIKFMSQFPHESIAEFVGFSLKDFEGDDNVVIIMKYYEKGSLTNCIEDLTKRKGQDILAGIAYGMMYLHKNKIIHRDLKPDNILLDDNIKPVISDLGIAKRASPKDIIQTEGKYTPMYCAPEAFEANYCLQSDVFSFAIIMFQIVTKKEPYPDIKSSHQLCFKVNGGLRPKFPEDIEIEPEMKELIEKCWDRNPSKRPSFEEIFYKFCEMYPENRYIQKLKQKLNGGKNEIIRKRSKCVPKVVKKPVVNDDDDDDDDDSDRDGKIHDLEGEVNEIFLNLTSRKAKIKDFIKDEVKKKNKSQDEEFNLKFDSLKSRFNKSDEMFNNLQSQISSFEKSMKRKINREEVDNKINSLLAANNKLEQRIIIQENQTKGQAKFYMDQFHENKGKFFNLQSQISNIEKNMKKKASQEEMDNKINSLLAANNKLEQRIIIQENQTKSQAKIYTDQFHENEGKFFNLQSQISNIEKNMKKRSKNREEMDNKINSLQNTNDLLKQQISDQEDQIKSQAELYMNQFHENEGKLFNLQSQISNIEKNMKKKANREEIDSKINSLLAANNKLEQRIINQENQTKSQADFCTNHFNENEEKLNNLQSDISSMKKKVKNQEELNNKINSLQKENDALKQQVLNQENQAKLYESRINKLEKNIEKMTANMSAQKSSIEQYVKNEIKKSVKNQEEMNNKINSLQKENDSLKEQISNYEGKIHELETAIEEITNDKNEIKSSLIESNEKIDSLKEQLSEDENRAKEKIKDFEKTLQDYQENSVKQQSKNEDDINKVIRTVDEFSCGSMEQISKLEENIKHINKVLKIEDQGNDNGDKNINDGNDSVNDNDDKNDNDSNDDDDDGNNYNDSNDDDDDVNNENDSNDDDVNNENDSNDDDGNNENDSNDDDNGDGNDDNDEKDNKEKKASNDGKKKKIKKKKKNRKRKFLF